MCTGWVLEMSTLDHYLRRYEVPQWLVFGWFWGWGTLDTRLARQKLGKKNTPQSWQPPSPYGRHGALLQAPPHTEISQHAARQVYVVKEKILLFLLIISYFKARRIVDAPCLCVCGLHQRAALRLSYSQWVALRV
jgi:hypothetical protein